MDKYRLIGAGYDLLSKVYSAGAIEECKLAMLRQDTIRPGMKILFAGSGKGSDAIHAARLGADVTVVDISPTMMSGLEAKLEQETSLSKQIKRVQQDILKHEAFRTYDMIVINFFLTIFDEEKMHTLLDHLIRLSKDEGQIVIGDFNPQEGSLLNQTIQNVYWYTAATAFFAMAGNAIHSIYDYRLILEKKGFQIQEEQHFETFGRRLFKSLMASRP